MPGPCSSNSQGCPSLSIGAAFSLVGWGPGRVLVELPRGAKGGGIALERFHYLMLDSLKRSDFFKELQL